MQNAATSRSRTSGWSVVLALTAAVFATGSASTDNAFKTTANATHHLVLKFNDAWNRCHLAGGANRDQLLAFFAQGATYLDSDGETWTGRKAINEHLCNGPAAPPFVDNIIESHVNGDLVTLQLQRRLNHKIENADEPTVISVVQLKAHTQILVLEDGLISRLISVVAPEAD